MRVYRAEIEKPPVEFRLKDVCEWHIVEGVCWHCRHTGRLDKRRLMRGRSPETRLIDLEGHLRCTVCEERGPGAGHSIIVRTAPRN